MASDRRRSDGPLDLSLRRVVDAPAALIWKAWTNPEHVKKWWTPAPWQTVACEIDLRPGGIFRTVMRSPEGQEFPHAGCLLELIENEKLVMTSALTADYRPAPDPVADQDHECAHIPFTAILTLEEHGGKTTYSVLVLHKDEAGRKRHEQLGFHEGWNTALDQLIELVTGWKR